MRLLINIAVAIPVLLGANIFGFTINTPEDAVKAYIVKTEGSYTDDYVISCITKKKQALCEKNDVPYVCYNSLMPPGCVMSKWSCIEWDNDMPKDWLNP